MAEMSQVEGNPEASSQANTPKDSRPLYEIGFHVVPTVEESKVGDIVEQLKKEVAKAGGELVGEKFPQKMVLAYVVERSLAGASSEAGKHEKYTESYFGWIRFVTEERAGIPSVEDHLRKDKNILRYLLVQTLPEEAQAPRRAVFSSNRLEGETIKKPVASPEAPVAEVSEEELNKSIDALVS